MKNFLILLVIIQLILLSFQIYSIIYLEKSSKEYVFFYKYFVEKKNGIKFDGQGVKYLTFQEKIGQENRIRILNDFEKYAKKQIQEKNKLKDDEEINIILTGWQEIPQK
jgi:hypothetical protein